MKTSSSVICPRFVGLGIFVGVERPSLFLSGVGSSPFGAALSKLGAEGFSHQQNLQPPQLLQLPRLQQLATSTISIPCLSLSASSNSRRASPCRSDLWCLIFSGRSEEVKDRPNPLQSLPVLLRFYLYSFFVHPYSSSS